MKIVWGSSNSLLLCGWVLTPLISLPVIINCVSEVYLLLSSVQLMWTLSLLVLLIHCYKMIKHQINFLFTQQFVEFIFWTNFYFLEQQIQTLRNTCWWTIFSLRKPNSYLLFHEQLRSNPSNNKPLLCWRSIPFRSIKRHKSPNPNDKEVGNEIIKCQWIEQSLDSSLKNKVTKYPMS